MNRFCRRLTLAISVACLLACAPGCDGDGPSGPPAALQGPSTPDLLLANFRLAYEHRNLVEYEKTLHPDFVFMPLPQDAAELGLSSGEPLQRAQELAIAEHMFSGAVGSGGFPALQDIEVVILDVVSEWAPSTDQLFPPPAQEALVRVELRFMHAYGYLRISGHTRLWALNVADEAGDHYYLLGQQDLTAFPKATQDATWGAVKAMFR